MSLNASGTNMQCKPVAFEDRITTYLFFCCAVAVLPQEAELAGAAVAAEARQPCAICGARDVLVPYAARPCGHRFCYYCLRANTLADARFGCPRCGARVEAMQPWRPEIRV